MLNNFFKKRIFLDHASITPVDPLVAREMAIVQKKFWANPSSIHSEGEKAKEKLAESRKSIAKIMRCKSEEIFFTSGGTESMNLAILGVARHYKKIFSNNPHIITTSIEHPAVLEPIKFLLKNGEAEVSILNPNEKGLINPKSVERELKRNTALVVIQHANNEIGTIQPIREISKILKDFNEKSRSNHFPLLLVDASQSTLYEDVSAEKLGAHMIVVDGIKIYGPRGIGFIFVKRGVDLEPIIFGGGQEYGLRSGTENLPAISGLAKAFEIAVSLREKESLRLIRLRDYTISKILEEIPNSSLNGDLENRLPNNINICFPKQDSEFLVIKLDNLGFAVSSASACHNLSLENSSLVIENIGKKDCAPSSLRITLGRDTKKSDLDSLISALKNMVK